MSENKRPAHWVNIHQGDNPDLEAFLAKKIYEHNARATGYHDAQSFSASSQNETGEIVAGISGYTWGGCCYVSYLWVSEACRGKGIGSDLLNEAEDYARRHHCRLIVLGSHTFQAPAFYAHKGYEQVARIDDYPVGHADIFFVKRLR